MPPTVTSQPVPELLPVGVVKDANGSFWKLSEAFGIQSVANGTRTGIVTSHAGNDRAPAFVINVPFAQAQAAFLGRTL